jgi:hypothetical protein
VNVSCGLDPRLLRADLPRLERGARKRPPRVRLCAASDVCGAVEGGPFSDLEGSVESGDAGKGVVGEGARRGAG